MTIQMKAIEQYFPVPFPGTIYCVVPDGPNCLSLCTNSLSATINMKAIE